MTARRVRCGSCLVFDRAGKPRGGSLSGCRCAPRIAQALARCLLRGGKLSLAFCGRCLRKTPPSDVDVGIGVDDIGEALFVARFGNIFFIAFADVAVFIKARISAFFAFILRHEHLFGEPELTKDRGALPLAGGKFALRLFRVAAERFRFGKSDLCGFDRLFVLLEFGVAARRAKVMFGAVFRLFAQIEIIGLRLFAKERVLVVCGM